MFELPECVTLAGQIERTLTGKVVRCGQLGNSPHKFVWYNRDPEEFSFLTQDKRVGTAYARGRWIFVPLEPGHVLVLGECGGKLLFHPPGAKLPEKYHLLIGFDDGSSLSAMTQMWGAMELYEAGQELERQYIKDMRPTPAEPAFDFAYFSGLIDTLAGGEKRSVKALLTQEQLIPGLGNSIAQDIMLRARLNPKAPIAVLTGDQRRRLFDAIVATVNAAIAGGGRNDELDLFGQPGSYIRLLNSGCVGKPCPQCGTAPVQKMQYLGGAAYFCPQCQAL